MSIYRFRLIVVGTAHFILMMVFGMWLLNEFRLYDPPLYSPESALTVHTLHLLVILVLRWVYDTPLETVQEAARLAGAKRQMVLNSDGSKRKKQDPVCIQYCYQDYIFYVKAGTIISVALGHWTFWLWLLVPEYNLFVTIPLGFAAAMLVWRRRMDFMGPGYQFGWDLEVENAAAGYWRETFAPTTHVV